jgi:type VI secretion system Hcp family effector
MKRLIALSIAILNLSAAALAAGDVNITIDSSKQGQVKTTAKEFRYSQSPRDLANAQSSAAMASAPRTSGRMTGAAGGVRRPNDPIVIIRYTDSASPLLVRAAAQGETLTTVLFEFVRMTGTGRPQVYQTVRLTNAMVSSVRTVNGADRPMEEVSFTFQKIEYENRDSSVAPATSWR